MNFKHLLYLIIFTATNIFPQSFSINGQVADLSTKKVLGNANVLLTQLSDSRVFGMISDSQGRFSFNYLYPGKYLLTISYVGYKTYSNNTEIKSKSIDLSTILLSPVGVKLNTVNITAKAIPAVIKGDTSEYSAAAFKTNKDATAEDLLTKMPGITVQNGTVQAQGENVTQVLVDGKPFFGSDPNAALKNLPAGSIEKVQVYDQQSDQSKFTGFDDGNTTKTINFVTRFRHKPGTFGKFTGGYGNDSKYESGGSLNIFNGDQRITILAQLNNINQQNFSIGDILGVMSGSGRMYMLGNRGQRPPGGGGGSGFRGGGPGGINISNFLVNQTSGLITTKAFGLNYSDKVGEKVDLTASYFFNYTNNDAESSTNRNYILSTSEQNYNESNSSNTSNINHRFNMRLDYQIDQYNSMLFTPSFTAQLNNGASNVFGITSSSADKLNSTNNLFNSNLTGINSSNDLLFRHRFSKRGRTISIDFNGSINNNSGDNKLYAQDLFYGNGIISDTINQFSNLTQHGYSGSTNLVYTEPISNNGILQFNSKFYYSQDNSNQKAYNIFNNNSYSLLDTSLSNVARKIYRTQSYGTGYRFRENNLIFALNLNYNIAQLENDQTFPQQGNIERTFNSFLPSVFFRYNIARGNNLRIFYRTNNDDPSINQLQSVLNNSDPTQLSIGNPNLSQDYKHSFILRYLHINGDHMPLFVLVGATIIQNYIGNNSIIAENDTLVLNNIKLNRGTRISFPINLNGYVNLHTFANYGISVGFIKSILNFNVNATYSRTPGIINNIINYANSNTYGAGFVLGSNISEKVDFTITSNSSYNYVHNSVQQNVTNNNNYFAQNAGFRFYWEFWHGIFLDNNINDQYNQGLSSTYKPNILLWNLSIGMKIFKNENGEIRFTANDILNQNTNIQHNVTDSYIEDVQTNVLGRYYLLSLVYNLRSF